MLARTAVLGTSLGLAGATALVVVPSAKIEVRGGTTRLTAVASVPLATTGVRSFDAGPVSVVGEAPATGVRPAVAATGSVGVSYESDPFASLGYAVQGLGEGIGSLACGFHAAFDWTTKEPSCPTPAPAPVAPRRFALPAGTRIDACPWPAPDPVPTPPCPAPVRLLTTSRVTLTIDAPGVDVPVRAAVPGAAGDLSFPRELYFTDYKRLGVSPVADLGVTLDGDISGGADPVGPIVSAADIARATAAAVAQQAQLGPGLRAAAEDGLRAGEELALPLTQAPVETDPSAAPGAQQSDVRVAATMRGSATAVPTAELRRLALAALTKAAGPSRHVLAGTVAWDPPVITPGAAPALTITAHGLVTAIDGTTLRLAAAWHGTGHVIDMARRGEPHATVEVQRSFGWSPALVFLDRRATVSVDGYPLN